MSFGRRLDRVITWLRPFNVQEDTSGGRAKDWIESGCAPAAIRSVSGREGFTAGAVQANVALVAEVRYRRDIDTGARVKVDGRTYEIAAVNEIGRRRGLALDLVEVRS